ncbi:MAG: nickel pincer cofactor biosynthesis protein LarB [Planctomycetales bacterium]|nr:nickel pincer cofactor biosynthesis protein LarB [Planctomycetales bacterium]
MNESLIEQLTRLLERPHADLSMVRQWLDAARTSAPASPTDSPSASAESLTLDLDRERRCGYPEVIYGPGKPTDVVVKAVAALHDRGQDALVTRVDEPQAQALREAFPDGHFNSRARTWRCQTDTPERPLESGLLDATVHAVAPVAVVTAGTSDGPVAEEAAETLAWMRVPVKRINDVGVAGPHRLVARAAELRECGAIVVVAGMEGALPSVVAGHVGCPVIGVPTSVGYGANFQGVAALLSMLNSCAANVVVVNIDAGFKGGYVAGMIARRHTRGDATDSTR